MTSLQRRPWCLCFLLAVSLSLAMASPAQAARGPEGKGALDAGVSQSTGEATLTVPIDVPRGTGGFQPELMLRYSSMGEDGPFGPGWSLSLGEVRRATRFGTLSFDDSPSSPDRFELDSELLVKGTGPGGGTEYRTQTETFSRIRRLGDSWEVTFASGVIARFGTTQQTRIRRNPSLNPAADTEPVARWLLSELQDVNGNVVLFTYDRSIDVGTAYPMTVSYTLHNSQPVGELRTVSFLLEDRPDAAFHATGGIAGAIRKRVKEIRSTAGTALFRRRMLYFGEGVYSTQRSRLTSTRVFGTNCSVSADPDPSQCGAMPSQQFTYTDTSEVIGPPGSGAPLNAHWSSTPWTPPTEFTRGTNNAQGKDNGVRFGDVNGDGLPDILRAYDGPGNDSSVWLNTGPGWTYSSEWSQRLAAVQFSAWFYSSNNPQPTKIFFAQERAWHEGNSPPIQGQVIDMNADGLADLVVAFRIDTKPNGSTWTFTPRMVTEVWINQGEERGWERDAALSEMPVVFAFAIENRTGSCSNSHTANREMVLCFDAAVDRWFYPIGATFVDLNGDRRPDLVANSESAGGPGVQNGAWINTEAGWVAKPEFTPPVRLLAKVSEILTPSGIQFADLNGDGLTDAIKTPVALVSAIPGSSQDTAALAASGVWLNTGTSWCDVSECPLAARYTPPLEAPFAREIDTHRANQGLGRWEEIITTNAVLFSDVNGDGLADLLRLDGSQPAESLTWIQSPGLAAAGGSVWVEDRRFRVPPEMYVQNWWPNGGSQGWTYDAGSRLIDWDGNGTADFVKSSQQGGGALWLSRSSIADRVRQVTNGEGGSVRFEYKSAIVQRDAALEDAAAADVAQVPNDDAGIELWAPLPVVTRLQVQGLDQAAPFDTTVAYARPRWCPVYRSGLGFRAVNTTLPGGSSTRSFFWQRHGRAGQLRRSEVYSGSQLVATAEATWAVLDGEDVPGSLPGADVGRLTAETRRTVFGPASGAVQTVDYGYTIGPNQDAGFNFVTTVATARPTGATVVERTPRSPDETNWIVGRVETEVTKDASTQSVLRSRQFGYSSNGLLTLRNELVKPRAGGTSTSADTSWVYDEYGNVIQTTDPEERSRYFCYDGDTALGPAGCPLSATQTHSVLAGVRDPLGGISALTSDLATGELRAITRFNQDRAMLVTDAFGRTTQLRVQPASYGASTLIERRVYHDGLTTSAGRPYVERFEQVGDGSEIRTARYFDGFGQVARTVYPTPTGSGYAGRASFRDYAQRPVHESYELACTNAHCSNLASPQSPAVVTTYDALGRPVTQSTPDGVSVIDYRSEAGYDVVIVKDAKGNLIQRLVDGDRVARVDECQAVSTPGYVTPGTLNCGGGAAATTYFYEPTGEVRKIVDPVGPATDPRHYLAYEYDTLGRVLRTLDPDAGISETSYDLVGNLFTTTNARGQMTVYGYDDLDRLTGVDRPPGYPDVEFHYDDGLNGTRRRESVSESGVYSISYAYDAFGRERRRVQQMLGATLVADFEYDLLGRATKVTYPNGAVVSYGYQGAYLEQVCASPSVSECVSAPQGPTSWIGDVVYDDRGREQEIFQRPGVARFAYNPTTYHLDQIRFTNVSNVDVLELSYLYDELGNVRQVTDTHDAIWTDGLNANAIYTYDNRNRLLSSAIGGAPTKWFNYDVLGNLIGRDGGGPGAHNQIYADPLRPHAITVNHLGQAYDYDADGNAIQRGSQHLTYDPNGRLTCIGSSPENCDQAVFRYDVDGTRLSETTSAGSRILMGDLFEWEAGANHAFVNVMAFGRRIGFEYSWNQTLRSAWVPAGWELPVPPRLLVPASALAVLTATLIYLLWLAARGNAVARPLPAALQLLIMASILIPNPAWAGGGGGATFLRRWISHDHLGNAVRFNEPGGATVKGRTFEPFGKVIAETADTEWTPRLFTGQRHEASSGLYDFRARWYDPEAGRFLSVDPIVQNISDPQTHNAYSYVRNNPVNFVDPDGLGFWKKFWNVVKIVLLVVAIVAYLSGNTYLAGLLGFAASLIGFVQEPSLMSFLLMAGAAVVASGAGGWGAAGAAAGGTASLSSGAGAISAGGLTLEEVGAIAQAGGDIMRSAKQIAAPKTDSQGYGGRPDLPIESPAFSPLDLIGAIGGLGWRLGSRIIGKAAARAGTQAGAREASTALGKSIQSLQKQLETGEGVWRRVTAHAEGSTSRSKLLRDSTSIEEVYENVETGQRLYRHINVKDGQILHERIRDFSKFGLD